MATASPCLPHIIPGLPNDLLVILVRVPRALHGSLRCVCSAWRDALQPLVVSALRDSLGISEMWVILLLDLHRIAFCDPLLRRLSASTCLCSSSFGSVHVLGAIGSQVFFSTQHITRRITIHGFDASSMQLQSNFVRLKVPMRDGFASVAFDGHVYLAGGMEIQEQYKSVVRVSVKTRTWDAMPDMHEIRVAATAVVMQGCLYVIGGCHYKHPLHSGEIWDPRRQEWILEPELWPARFFKSCVRPKVAVVLDTLYALRNESMTHNNGEEQWELMRYDCISKVWTSVGYLSTGQTSCMCDLERVYNLVGTGKELWVVINCKQLCDAIIMSCVPPIGTQPIRWRQVTNTSSFGFEIEHTSAQGHVFV